MKTWVETQTKDGRFSNVSDYMRDLIRRDQARQTALLELQELVDAGLNSGPAQAFDMQSFIAGQKAR